MLILSVMVESFNCMSVPTFLQNQFFSSADNFGFFHPMNYSSMSSNELISVLDIKICLNM